MISFCQVSHFGGEVMWSSLFIALLMWTAARCTCREQHDREGYTTVTVCFTLCWFCTTTTRPRVDHLQNLSTDLVRGILDGCPVFANRQQVGQSLQQHFDFRNALHGLHIPGRQSVGSLTGLDNGSERLRSLTLIQTLPLALSRPKSESTTLSLICWRDRAY